MGAAGTLDEYAGEVCVGGVELMVALGDGVVDGVGGVALDGMGVVVTGAAARIGGVGVGAAGCWPHGRHRSAAPTNRTARKPVTSSARVGERRAAGAGAVRVIGMGAC